jgi:2-phosphosulfolactate phosphatase
MVKTVVIDYLPERVKAYGGDYAIVAVDVIRATTTAVTGVALGRKCFPAPSVDAAHELAKQLTKPLLVGEVGGVMPQGFQLNNSPAELALRSDLHRPMILVSSSGTRLICGAAEGQPLYVACLRNYSAQVAHLAAHHSKVALIGAGTKGEFREEDQLCCAWIAEGLFKAGYKAENASTIAIVERWRGVQVEVIVEGASAEYLRRTKQVRDLDFILAHLDDLDEVYRFEGNQVLKQPGDRRSA